jgi:hypothetical protein
VKDGSPGTELSISLTEGWRRDSAAKRSRNSLSWPELECPHAGLLGPELAFPLAGLSLSLQLGSFCGWSPLVAAAFAELAEV